MQRELLRAVYVGSRSLMLNDLHAVGTDILLAVCDRVKIDVSLDKKTRLNQLANKIKRLQEYKQDKKAAAASSDPRNFKLNLRNQSGPA